MTRGWLPSSQQEGWVAWKGSEMGTVQSTWVGLKARGRATSSPLSLVTSLLEPSVPSADLCRKRAHKNRYSFPSRVLEVQVLREEAGFGPFAPPGGGPTGSFSSSHSTSQPTCFSGQAHLAPPWTPPWYYQNHLPGYFPNCVTQRLGFGKVHKWLTGRANPSADRDRPEGPLGSPGPWNSACGKAMHP